MQVLTLKESPGPGEVGTASAATLEIRELEERPRAAIPTS